MKPKHQRLVLALAALAAIIGAGLLAAYGLQDQASYFYTPSDMVAKAPEAGQNVRLGGMVKKGSMARGADGVSVRFIVMDGKAERAVVYKGITPDLFVEGSGVVADGKLGADGVFIAETLLAKHDENYTPRELENMDMNAMRKSAETIAQ